MSLFCHICTKELEQSDGIYICPDGHISQYTQEVMEEDQKNISERSRKIKTENNEPTFLKVYKFFTMMYIKMKKYFGINTDIVFKIMLVYHHGDTIDLFTFNCLYAILYYALRAQKEKSYECLVKCEFEDIFPRAYYMNVFNKYINEYNLVNDKDIVGRFMLDKPVSCAVLLEWLKLFGNVCYKTRDAYCFVPSVTQKDNLEVKRIFRAMVRRDVKIMNMYLEKVTSALGITLKEDVTIQFERFCDFYLDNKRVFVPEMLICTFLYLYAATNDFEINLEIAEKTLCYKEDIHDMFKREISEQIYISNNKGNLDGYKKFKKSFEIDTVFKPLCKFKKKANLLKYIFSVYVQSTEEVFMWFVNNQALFMDHASSNNIQEHLDKEVKGNLYYLYWTESITLRIKENSKARKKERQIKVDENNQNILNARILKKASKKKKDIKRYVK